MSGVWYEGNWFEHTGHQCRRCGHPVFESDLRTANYDYQCFHCNQHLFSFETDRETAFPRIVVARPFDGVTINTALEYLLDENDQIKVFGNQLEAESFLTDRGVQYDDLAFLHFIIYDGVPSL